MPGPIRTADEVGALGVTLGVWAHPDDEAYLSGGLMALLGAAGHRVVCVTATRGERGTADPLTWPPARLAAARSAELAACLAILGVKEHRWLNHPDGGCSEVPSHVGVHQLVEIMREVQPRPC